MIATLQQHSKTSLFALCQHNGILQTIYQKFKPIFDFLSLVLIILVALVYGLTTGVKIAYQILSSPNAMRCYHQTWCIIVHMFYILKTQCEYALACNAVVFGETYYVLIGLYRDWQDRKALPHQYATVTQSLPTKPRPIDPFSAAYLLATDNRQLTVLQQHTARFIENGNYSPRLIIQAWDSLKSNIRINGKDGMVIPIETIAGIALSISIANGYCQAITDKAALGALLGLCDSNLEMVETQHNAMRNEWYSLTPIEKRWKKRNVSNDPSYRARSQELQDRLREHTIGEYEPDTDYDLPAFEDIMSYHEHTDSNGTPVDYHTFVDEQIPF